MSEADKPYSKPVLADGYPKGLGRVYVVSVRDDENGFKVYLAGGGSIEPALLITFDSVYAYRNANESSRTEYWKKIGGYIESGLYTISASDFSDWIVQQEPHRELPIGANVFILATPEDVIDIISFDSPIIEILNNSND